MTEKVRYRCRNCGEEFTVDILTEEEKREARRRDEPVSPVRCPNPKCGRQDYYKISN